MTEPKHHSSKFYCQYCDYTARDNHYLKKHNNTARHLKVVNGEYKLIKNISKTNFYCSVCDIYKKSNWDLNNHNNTQRHIKVLNGELKINQKCSYVKKSGEICNLPCYNDFCRKHNERKLAYNRSDKRRTENKIYRYTMKNNFNSICNLKVKHHREHDIIAGREIIESQFISINWMRDELEKLDNKCCICKKVMKLCSFEEYDSDQFTVDRINNSFPHHIYNCQICCLQCNIQKPRYKEKHQN